jgi:hypothetical protein
MFCIPLEETRFSALSSDLFEKFERNSKKKFFWKNGALK